MVFDCFSFFNEFDVLEIRLNELRGVVDQFVICESTHTFSGKPKPLYLTENMDRFSGYPIKLLVFDEPDAAQDISNLWNNEFRQKGYLKTALMDCKDDDTIMMSDVDEIPFPNVVQSYRDNGFTGSICTLGMHASYYFANVVQENYWWGSAVITTWNRAKTMDMFSLRNGLHLRERLLCPCGFHFSYLGGVESIRNKISSWPHVADFSKECYTEENIRQCLCDLKDLFGRECSLMSHDPFSLENFPRYILNNLGKFKNLLHGPNYTMVTAP